MVSYILHPDLPGKIACKIEEARKCWDLGANLTILQAFGLWTGSFDIRRRGRPAIGAMRPPSGKPYFEAMCSNAYQSVSGRIIKKSMAYRSNWAGVGLYSGEQITEVPEMANRRSKFQDRLHIALSPRQKSRMLVKADQEEISLAALLRRAVDRELGAE